MKSKTNARQDTRRQRKQISTYPSDWAWELLGGGASTVATAAVECWAQVLAAATQDNEETFTPAEWEGLAEWLSNQSVHELVPHTVRAPGVVLAMALADAYSDLGGLSMTPKLKAMDYAHVWAVLWALDWRQRRGEGVGVAEWWTLAARLHTGKV